MFDKIYDLIIGIGSLLIGIALIIVQISSYVGNIKAGVEIPFFMSFESSDLFFYDLFGILGYNLIGLIGLGFLIKAALTLKNYINSFSNMWDSRQEKKKKEDNMDRQQQSEREYIYAEAYNGATVRIPKDRYHEWKATQDKLRAGEEVPEVKETAKKLAALMRGEETQNESQHNKKQEETECRVEEKPKQNDWDQKIMSIITSQRIAAVFSLLLCISLYFSLLSTVFTQKIDTYVVFNQEDSNVIHGSMGCTGKS